MNVLADFIVRVEEQYPLSIENEELNSLLLTIRNQASEIKALNKEVASLRTTVLNDAPEVAEKPKKATKRATKKTATK